MSWKVLFASSSRDHGTLGHLFSQLGRLPKANAPKKDFHACFDALMTVFKGHVVASACKVLEIDQPDDDIPLAKSLSKQSVEDQRAFLFSIATQVAKKCSIISDAIVKPGQKLTETKDGIYNYARVLCHHASLVVEFSNGRSNGDGPRMMRCWRIFLLHFHANKRYKYALEALRIQFQLKILPPHLVHSLTWGRFINTHGGSGHNIPCDLHNEHVNKLFKNAIGCMGANFTEQASTCMAQSITTLDKIVTNFDKQTNLCPETSAHCTKSGDHDVKQVVSVVLNRRLLDIIPGRKHSSFKTISANPLSKLDKGAMDKWIKGKVMEAMKYKRLAGGEDSETSDVEDSCDSDSEDV